MILRTFFLLIRSTEQGWANCLAFSANQMFDKWSIFSRLGWRCWVSQIGGPFQLIRCLMSGLFSADWVEGAGWAKFFGPLQLIGCLMSDLFSTDCVEGAGWAKFSAFSANSMIDEWSIFSLLGWRCWVNQIFGAFSANRMFDKWSIFSQLGWRCWVSRQPGSLTPTCWSSSCGSSASSRRGKTKLPWVKRPPG